MTEHEQKACNERAWSKVEPRKCMQTIPSSERFQSLNCLFFDVTINVQSPSHIA